MAQQLGVQSTPTFVINGRPVVGAQPFESFQQVIESILSSGDNTQ
jgi:protein-disulfide isomerase